MAVSSCQETGKTRKTTTFFAFGQVLSISQTKLISRIQRKKQQVFVELKMNFMVS